MFPVGDCADLYFVSMISFQLDLLLCRGSASLSMWAKQVSRWEMPAGSSSAWSMVLGLMASSWTLQLKQTLEKILSTLSSTLGALGVTFHERYTWTWSPLWLVSSFDYVLFLPSLFFLINIWGPIICGHKYQVWRISIHMSHVQTGIQATSAVVSPSPFIEWILCKQLDVEGNIQWIWAGKEHFLPLCLNLFPDFYCFILYNCLPSLHWTVLK